MKTIFQILLLTAFMGGSLYSQTPKAANQTPEKLIFNAPANAFDTLWDHLNVKTLEAKLPQQAPGATFAVRRFREGGLTIICLINIDKESQRQCDFYSENPNTSLRDKNIGGVLEFRGADAKAIASKFLLKKLWHLHPIEDGKKIWRAGYAITTPKELFLWVFYFDGKEYYAHFSRVWNPKHYVFDMFERKSSKLFNSKTDSFPRKKIVYTTPTKDPLASEVDDLFLEGMRKSLFGGLKRRSE